MDEDKKLMGTDAGETTKKLNTKIDALNKELKELKTSNKAYEETVKKTY